MRLNDALEAVPTSPITEAYSWTANTAQARGVTARRQGDGQFFDVSQAVPGYPPAESLRHHLAELALRDDVHGYTDQLGVADLRGELAAHTTRLYRAERQPVRADQVGITAGCNQAFCLAVAALASAGDEVLLPVPYYFNHDMWLRAMQIEPVYVACDAQQLPRLDTVAEQITGRTRALVLISPNNPTGAVVPAALLDEAFQLCKREGIALVLDETYRDFLVDADAPERGRSEDGSASLSQGLVAPQQALGPMPHCLFQPDDWQDVLVHLFSFSKVFCLAAHRVGAIIASTSLLEQAAKAMDCVAICPPRLGQEAALYGLRHLAPWVAGKRQEMAARLELFHAALEGYGRQQWKIASSGAYFAYVRHPWPGEGSRAVAERLAREHAVLALAGGMFGPHQEEYLRVAFANLDRSRIEPLVARLCAASAAG